MAFESNYKTYILTTGATSSYMSLPTYPAANGTTVNNGASNARYLLTNPSTTLVQYYACYGSVSNTLVASTPVVNGPAVEGIGTPILPGQQVVIGHNMNSLTPYIFGLSPGGAAQLIVTRGSGDI